MTELQPLDAGFIELKDSDQHISLGIGAVAVISGAPPTRAQFAEVLAGRLDENARLRQRMRRAALDLTAPVWEEDPNFDLAHHIRWTALPEPADESALFEFVATELEERLDRDHPLWQCVIVERLSDDRWALLVKAHHSLVDGVSGVTLFASLCDRDGEVPDLALVPEPAASSPSSLFGLVAGTVRWAVDAPRAVTHMVRSLIPLAVSVVTPTAGSSLNGPIGRKRRYVVARASLAEIREIDAAFGTTVNDVVLAAVASAYRALLLRRDEQPTHDKLRILVPVSMRAADAKYLLDKRVSAMLPFLPIEIADPVERLSTIHRRMTKHKSRGETQAEKSLIAMASRLPFASIAWTLRLVSRLPQRGVTAVATNIPGPRHPLTVHGRKVLDLLPAVPIAMRLRTGIAILSYGDELNFGITGDYDTTPDIDILADEIQHGIGELLSAARSRPTPPPELTAAPEPTAARSRSRKR
ncbi:WS/DGAT/MGAT family O-acyltransferase [Nocardia crassostreae]|uniref:WS/DGAT/MGAT family O-acyltransferase n=1 Tax=Nocardia crassostreae TaxID=53428 RepID=UPI0008353ABB|nr:wax ester/triacylglycerol synthase family O-acyltransferase [Nocardia crassostreae]